MNGGIVILIAEAVAVYLLVLGCHSLRHRVGLGPFYALLGGLTAVMSWVTDAGVQVEAAGITFMVGSTVFYTALLLGVFVVYVFDGVRSTRLAILTVAGISAMVPLIAEVLHAQARLSGVEFLSTVPVPSLRINSASVITTIADLLFLAMAWEFLGKPLLKIPRTLRVYLTLLGVLWLDVVFFSTGAFLGTPHYLSIMQGTLLSRLVVSVFVFPFLSLYLEWQNRKVGGGIESRPVLAILREVEEARSELSQAKREIERRQKAEEALGTSERKYRELYENAPIGIFTTTSDGSALAVNPAMARILGCATPQEVIARYTNLGQHLYVSAERRAEFLSLLKEQGTAKDFEYQARAADGRRVWINMSARISEKLRGGAFTIEGFAIDVTERKRTIEALEESERKWKDILLHTPQIGVGIDPKARIVFANDHFLQLTGWEEEDVLGKDWFATFIPREQREQLRADFIAAMTSGETVESSTYESTILTRGGERRDVAWFNVLTKDAEGVVVDVTCLGVDLTERKHAEEELRHRESMLQKIFDILPIGLWFADNEGNILRGNPAGVKIWGAEPHVPLMEYGVFKARRLPSGEPIAPHEWALARTIREGITVQDELLEIDAFDGQTRTILNYTTPILDEHGKVQGAIVLNQDVTDRRQAEDERANLEQQYRHAQKMDAIGQLTGGVAHDFNNLLQVISGATDMALEDVPQGHPAHESLLEVAEAGQRAARLVEQLLLFSRRQIMRPGVLELNGVVTDLLQMLRRVIGEHVRVEWTPGEELASIHADRGMIEQTIVNLCVNARDAMPEGGTITLATSNITIGEQFIATHQWAVEGEYVLLSVTDTGIGMNKETLDHIFEPFFTTKEVGKGTGLGLATVYGIVKQHGGMITAESQPGEGSIFHVYLPVSGMEAGPVKSASHHAPVRGSETILLAEDDEMVRNLARLVLERAGYTVLATHDGASAVALFRKHASEIDLAILDVVMPGMGGREALDEMRRIRPGAKVLFASGYSENALHTNFVLDEGLTLIAKPYGRDTLLRAVRNVLAKPN
ncbi:MAG: hypothetical protein PWP23_1360 [Candidatus Sumerlaeota bacterium]|nr:hypothetical protein [Candidatus Sumerlaeota bacterium]